MNTFTWVFGVIELGNLTDSIFVLCLDVSDSFFHVNMLLSSCLKSTPVSSLFPVLVNANPVFGTPSIVKVHPVSPGTSSDKANLK